jgi:hypothetical protein
MYRLSIIMEEEEGIRFFIRDFNRVKRNLQRGLEHMDKLWQINNLIVDNNNNRCSIHNPRRRNICMKIGNERDLYLPLRRLLQISIQTSMIDLNHLLPLLLLPNPSKHFIRTRDNLVIDLQGRIWRMLVSRECRGRLHNPSSRGLPLRPRLLLHQPQLRWNK